MKKVFLSLLSLLSLVSISAHEIVVGDMDGDGNVTIKDVTECANTVIGKSAVKTISAKTLVDPNASDFTSLAGTWRSSDENVAEVSSKGVVSVNGYGRCVITCTANDGSGVSASCSVIVEKPIDYNGHDYVDLGLSVKWATMNVGATEVAGSKKNSHTGKLDCYGEYYAWGETSPKHTYNWSNLKYRSDSYGNTFSKYVASSSYGTIDNKTTLELSDDAASANWGGSWRMPTITEQQELINNCYWEWTTSYNNSGVKGYIVYKVKNDSDKGKHPYYDTGYSRTPSPTASYSLSDTHIFLPASGYRYDSSFSRVGSDGYYWSSSLITDGSSYAYGLGFYSGCVNWYYIYRNYGRSVRPVCP